jgi:hypothetical protein
VKEGKYGGNIMYENGKMRPVETILRRGDQQNDGQDKSS